jgi:putative ATP-dependent endonuclease of OLD family
MYLHKLHIQGFKRLCDVEIELNNASFLIGQNNSGKSSILKAISYLLNNKQIVVSDFYSEMNEDSGECEIAVEKIVMTAEFRNVCEEATSWRGFNGRIFDYTIAEDDEETGKCIFYKKEWTPGKAPVQYLKARKRVLKDEYTGSVSKIEDLLEAGISETVLTEAFKKLAGNISKTLEPNLDYIDEIWDFTDEEEFFKNPGGIAGNVLSRLPRYLLIPADSGEAELSKTSGTLQKTLKELFKEVRDSSENYAQAQTFLNSLATELDPQDENSDFGQMLSQLNNVMSTVFPESSIEVTANLSNADDVLVPQFDVAMKSNISTSVANQGTGMIRATVFSLLRFRKHWEEERAANTGRGLIICFEEPEIFLHPSAANQMRKVIYDLVSSSSQIIASTHSPYMIDLARKPHQNLIRITKNETGGSSAITFTVTEAFNRLQNEDKTYVKMILKIDDYVARAFFGNRIILVEGDTEDIVIKETTRRLPDEQYNYVVTNCEVIKGRGKPVLKSLIIYLKSLGINPIVMHDLDTGVAGAVVHNEPIRQALGNDDDLYTLDRYLEDILEYDAPSSEKPYRAYRETITWGDNYTDIPERWRTLYENLMGIEAN